MNDILIAVTGSIAAYKSCELVRNLVKSGYTVRVIMTSNATEFIGKITFEALTGKPVLIDEYESGMPHIESKTGISVMAVVPATANIIAKFANGIADDLVTSTYLAMQAPVLIAPAMNPGMWNHPATKRNIDRLKEDGVSILSPQDGVVICGDEGQGKLADVPIIEKKIIQLHNQKLQSI
ncbi:MAG: phosphopantothenoylcysteine decarboxylase [Leptospira sp.]|nr:phosphopantothenoylcysteine decarboxylase [Leptospira sp.]